MKEIEVAARRVDRRTVENWEPDEDTPEGWVPIEFPIQDERQPEGRRDMVAFPPGDGQLAAFMTTSASFASNEERVAGAVNFLASVLDDDGHSYIVSRLFDGKDPFGTRQVLQIIEGLIEEWSGKATGSRSGSAPSRAKAGRKSTRPTPALT